MSLQKLSFEKNVRFVDQQFILEIKKMKDLGTLAKKYLFPALVIITGLYLVFMGIVPDSETGISQNSSFLIGGFTILLLGVLILLFVMDIIKSRKIQIGLYLALLLPMCLLLTNALYSSINTTIEEIETKKQKDILIKQALNDIKDIELEYRKKYGWFSNDFDELKRFLKVYPNEKNVPYAHYLLGMVYYEKIVDEKKDLEPLVLAEKKFKFNYF